MESHEEERQDTHEGSENSNKRAHQSQLLRHQEAEHIYMPGSTGELRTANIPRPAAMYIESENNSLVMNTFKREPEMT